MVQKRKSTFLDVLEVFFIEPTALHFVKEIGKKIKISPTSVRTQLKELLRLELIKRKKARPFDGFVANRENDDFIFYKRVYNLYSLKEVIKFLISNYYPKLFTVYGSYSIGEDIEESDIDLLIISKTQKTIELKKFEKLLKRNIHLIVEQDFKKLQKNLKFK